MSDRVYGRERELALLRRAMEETAAGAGGCHLLTGPAGIGKSRLLRVAGDLADRFDIAVAAREAFPHDLAAPLVTLAGALRNCSPPAAEFAWLSDPGRHDEPFVMLERLRASLEDYAARRPLLVIIDDAHWMDELSALAIRQLVPALASSPVRWLFADRSDQLDAPGRPTLDWLARAGYEPILLGVLDSPAVAAFCGDQLGATADHTVLALATGCGGNPLRVGQLLTALRRTGQLTITDDVATVAGDDLPSGFVDTVRDILASLSPDTQQLLRGVSVLARPFGIEAAARLMRREPADLFGLIEEAMVAGLITEDVDDLVFAHDLVRQAVYNDLRRAVREQLHRAATAVAREENRPALEIAEHLLASGRTGTSEAVALLRTAADEVAGTAPATAADLMLEAIKAIGPDHPENPALTARAVGLLASAARLGEAQTLGEQALRAGLGAQTEAELLLGLAEAFKHAGQNPAAVSYADQALHLAGITEAVQARLHAVRAHALVYVDRLADADDSGAAADRLGRGSDPGAAVFGLAARSVVAHTQGRLTDALDHARAATDLADRSGGPARHRHPRIWLGSALITSDRFDEADHTLRQGRRESEQLGTAWAQPLYHYYQATLLTLRGRLDEATAEADGGLATAEQLTAYQLAVPLLGVLLRLAVLRGDLGQAQVYLGRMRRLSGAGVTVALEDIAWPEALINAAGGKPVAGFARLTAVVDAMPDRCLLLTNDPSAAANMISMALAAGDRPRAGLIATTARRLADRNPWSHSALAAAAHAEGLLHGDPKRLGEAVAQYRATPRPLALAAALEDAGEFTEALEIVTDCRATGPQRRLEKLAGGPAGAPPPAAPRPPCLPQLSPAERKVALLVAQGRTNLQVAEQLFLSRHTVDSHLRKIFAKLDIRRRVELATLVARECGEM